MGDHMRHLNKQQMMLFSFSRQTDGQTDRQTDRRVGKVWEIISILVDKQKEGLEYRQ